MRQNNDFLEKIKITHCFNRAAQSYDQAAHMQYHAGNKLIAHLKKTEIEPKLILDVGGGTGHLAKNLAACYPQAKVLMIDLADKMLMVAREKNGLATACADFAALPLADHRADVIYANMSLHWSSDLVKTLRELKRVLTPTGALVFSIPLQGSLHELITSIKQNNSQAEVNEFYDLATLKSHLQSSGFTSHHELCETYCEYHTEAQQILRQIRLTGTHHVKFKSGGYYAGKTFLNNLSRIYEKYRQVQGLPMTYRVFYGMAK